MFYEKNNHLVFYYPCTDGRLKYYTGIKAGQSTKKFEAFVIEIVSSLEELTKDKFKEALDIRLQKNLITLEKLQQVVDRMKQGKVLTPDNRKYASNSIRAYENSIKVWKEYGEKVDYNKFLEWCNEKDFSKNYTGSVIKNLKRLSNLLGFKLPFKKIKEHPDDIYLDESEIEAMYKLTLPLGFSIVRDWFVFDCYTGLRHSDLNLLTNKNFTGEFIIIANKKTGERVKIPAHRFVKQILKKYDGFPPAVTNSHMNKLIKAVAKFAGINDETIYTMTKGGERKHYYYKKWELVSCHTARRSFVTNLIKSGITESIIMKLTGIRNHETLKRYNKLTVEDAAEVMKQHKFFL